MILARHLHATAAGLPGRIADPPHERPGGIDAEGRAFTVIIARTH